jgi:ATP-dependent Clp protease ATP-binding subunit ClpC
MTSNIGLDQFKAQAAIGFASEESVTEQADKAFEKTSQGIKQSLHDYFRPEFLNRIDKVVIFRPLSKSVAKKIIHRECELLNQRLIDKGRKIQLDSATVNYLVNRGFNVDEGARSLKRFFQEQITNPLAEAILKDEVTTEFSTTIKDHQVVLQH